MNYVGVSVKNNFGISIWRRLDKNDTIKDAKIKLASSLRLQSEVQPAEEIRAIQDGGQIDAGNMRLYRFKKWRLLGQFLEELDENKTVEGCNIQDNDQLFLVIYRWGYECDVRFNGKQKLRGIDKEDTCLGIKVKAQDQLKHSHTEFMLYSFHSGVKKLRHLQKISTAEESRQAFSVRA